MLQLAELIGFVIAYLVVGAICAFVHDAVSPYLMSDYNGDLIFFAWMLGWPLILFSLGCLACILGVVGIAVGIALAATLTFFGLWKLSLPRPEGETS